jgi:putative tryptophan/tyrosine transport system substrate-binding protein
LWTAPRRGATTGQVISDRLSPSRSVELNSPSRGGVPARIASAWLLGRPVEHAFRTSVNAHAAAVWIFGDPMFVDNRDRLAALAVNMRLPTLFTARQFADAGASLCTRRSSPSSTGVPRLFVDKILKGAKPGDLPVEQPTKCEFVINLKTAKALGLTIPPSILVRADEIIQ